MDLLLHVNKRLTWKSYTLQFPQFLVGFIKSLLKKIFVDSTTYENQNTSEICKITCLYSKYKPQAFPSPRNDIKEGLQGGGGGGGGGDETKIPLIIL